MGTGAPVGSALRHDTRVWQAEFSPDRTRIVTASEGEVRVWDLPTAPSDVTEITRQTSLATGAQLDADGRIESVPWAEWQAMRNQEATR